MFEASPETINELRPLDAAGTIKLDFVDAPSTYRIYMNTSRPALRDVRVRQAIAYAIDKKLLVDRLTGGNGHRRDLGPAAVLALLRAQRPDLHARSGRRPARS